MRTKPLIHALAAIMLATAGNAVADDRSLTSDEVGRYASVYFREIRSCYLDHAPFSRGATGELSVKLLVHRNGYVQDVSIEAPGVRGRPLRALTQCIRVEVLGWHFPVRRDFTTAILPYQFLHVNAPGSGPYYGCWNPRGCRRKPVKPRGPWR